MSSSNSGDNTYVFRGVDHVPPGGVLENFAMMFNPRTMRPIYIQNGCVVDKPRITYPSGGPNGSANGDVGSESRVCEDDVSIGEVFEDDGDTQTFSEGVCEDDVPFALRNYCNKSRQAELAARNAEAQRRAAEARQRAVEANRRAAEAERRAAEADRRAAEADRRAAERDAEARRCAAERSTAAATTPYRLPPNIKIGIVGGENRGTVVDCDVGCVSSRGVSAGARDDEMPTEVADPTLYYSDEKSYKLTTVDGRFKSIGVSRVHGMGETARLPVDSDPKGAYAPYLDAWTQNGFTLGANPGIASIDGAACAGIYFSAKGPYGAKAPTTWKPCTYGRFYPLAVKLYGTFYGPNA